MSETAPPLPENEVQPPIFMEDSGTPVETSGADSTQDMASRLRELRAFAGEVQREVARVIKGQESAIRLSLIALLVRGHVLLEGNPGTAKTLLVRTIGRICSLDFKRVQFTPDLMPSDITGTSIFRPDRVEFEFRKGPLFTDLLLADEINRAPSRTQAALLQAMQEGIVSADGTDYELSSLFTVVATQNPIESEGTYPLPEAELDRFLFKVLVDYPDEMMELEVFRLHGCATSVDAFAGVGKRLDVTRKQLTDFRDIVYQVRVNEDVVAYTLRIIRATRSNPFLIAGASTRAGVMLLRAARASAALSGRNYVVPDDVRDLVPPVLRHRIFRSASAELEGIQTDLILDEILQQIPVPR